jgi:membrane associated rhomboid family serine protease
VFPISTTIVVMYCIGLAVVGAAIGAFIGLIAPVVSKPGPTWILKDAFLGASGMLAGWFGCVLMSSRRITTSYALEGGRIVVTSTMKHPEGAAVVVAVLLPIVHELYRFRRARAN